ncbi:hypothetical protein DCAR_0520141 [Daucus carota subsp. sativus]|uniref:Transmembrane protein n=1 Tax=Daucus carota subsp. sativus TaxID=79200 RepID=A0AAF0X6N5_DAUCS|nr:hypothetical protein DCAR_0520141 [Daucus carota subsp. sativus]
MCRLLVVERTAWTENNAGRRFVSCKSNCRVQKFRCLNVKMFLFIVVVIWFVWTRF